MNILLLPELDNNQSCISITNLDQINHVQKVLRLKAGDSLKVGSLKGKLGTAVIEAVSDKQLKLGQLNLNTMPPS
ncbi:MAG TPA: 16S rRNA (uracil(1498)-N(3))-methyltransferase, partial [Psychrobacter sp.]|nr:16S rRNA (uracil(1498)-N(3))-methyltransferase [Psychrobacter sp.]